MTDWQVRAQALADELIEAGAIRDPVWQDVFAATPRHVFIPRFYTPDQYNQPRTLVDSADPEMRDTWLAAAYRNTPLVTHYQPLAGAAMPDGQEVRAPTSSASMPGIVAIMLDRLQVADRHRVLEIGTGTGYHAALLCTRLGDARVTSIEVDQDTAAEAARHLKAAGLAPRLVVGDGAAGHPDRAPYDRIIATCAVAGRIPPAWIDQLADEGILVTPLALHGGLAVLRKTAPGQVTGRLDREQAYFMSLRPGEPASRQRLAPSIPGLAGPVWHTTTSVPARAWDDSDFRLWLNLYRPEIEVAINVGEGGDKIGATVYTADRRAGVDYEGGDHAVWPVRQDQAQLWDHVEAAWHSWLRHGQPDRTRIGITARSAGGQFAWLDKPDGAVRWPLR